MGDTKLIRAGAPPLPPGYKKERVTVSMRPKANAEWSKLAHRAKTSKGDLVTWFLFSPETEELRKQAVERARFFVLP